MGSTPVTARPWPHDKETALTGPPQTTQTARHRPLFSGYRTIQGTYDEFFAPDGEVRPGVADMVAALDDLGRDEFRTRMKIAEATFLRGGITFSVYSDDRGSERVFPFDLIPRAIAAAEWAAVERGLEQRVRALDAFLADVYHRQRIIKDRVIPRRLVEGSAGWVPQARAVTPQGGRHIHIAGIDLVRQPDGSFAVLEDNVRTPSGVSYVLENRAVMKRAFPRIFERSRVQPVDEYPMRLREALRSVAPGRRRPRIVILTPGVFNSAYFEHAFLARRMGCELVQGADLFVERDHVFVRTTQGPMPVDVIYRRVDDAYLDPTVFRSDSVLGVPGLFAAYAAGNVTLANAVGNGVADDKAVYPYVPKMIRYYLGEDSILQQIRTYSCARRGDREYVLQHLAQLVVKAVDSAGGYGMLVGPQSTRSQQHAMAERIREHPRGYIAQPLLELSTCPAWIHHGVAPRRVDLRPYVVSGKDTWVLPGGLTRVALRRGSYVVNSSQGGGSKDTWVLDRGRP